MKLRVKEQHADREIYLAVIHCHVHTGRLTQADMQNLHRIGCEFLFEEVEPAKKKASKENDTDTAGTE